MLTVSQATSSSHLEVVEPPQAMSTVPVEAPLVFDAGDILIPGTVSTLHYFRGSSNLLNTQDNHAMLAAPTSGPAQVAGTRGLAPFACRVFTAQQRRSNVPQRIWEPHQSVFEASLPLAG